MTRLRHYDNCGTARFVTFTCYRQHRYLSSYQARHILLQGLTHLRTERNIRILGWVFMPEHVHLVLYPPDDASLGLIIGRLKSWTARQVFNNATDLGARLHRSNGRLGFWERRFFDYNCRNVDEVREKIEYCHKNPVIRGLVRDASLWPWSSYNWYRRQGQIVLEIDGMEL